MTFIFETTTETDIDNLITQQDLEAGFPDSENQTLTIQFKNKHLTLDKWWTYRDRDTNSKYVDGSVSVQQAIIDDINGNSIPLDAINAGRDPVDQIDPTQWSTVSIIDVADLIASGYLADPEI